MTRAQNRLSRFTGIRLLIAIQVFSFLLVIITGFFALEVGSVELNRGIRSAPFYTFQTTIREFFSGTGREATRKASDEQVSVAQIKDALNKMRLTVLVCGFVAFFSGIVLNHAIRNTLKKLTLSLRSVAQGDFTGNLEIYSQEEMGQVVRAYNRMVSSINRYMIENSAGAVFTMNRDGIITSFNPMAEIMFHRDYRDVVGSHFTEIFPVTSRNRVFTDMLMRGIEHGEPGSRENLWIVTPDGEKRARRVATSILSGDDGKLLEVVTNFGDFEQVKEIQTQMERMNRLASLGSLVAGLAHEIRTPLGSLKGFTQLLGEDLVHDEKKRRYTEIILKEIDRLNRVMEELLNFAQPSVGDFEPRDINEIVRDTLVLVQASFAGRSVRVIERYMENLPKVVIERDRLIQAMLNILNNAFEATPDDGQIIVETKMGPDGELKHGQVPQAPGFSKSVIVDFTNTGTTVSFGAAKRMFDPFFTTKERGTGLGLAIAQQVTMAHGGSLTVFNPSQSGEDEAVTFRIELPAKPSGSGVVNGSPGPS